MQRQTVETNQINRTTVLVEGVSTAVQHNERTACSICRKNRHCNWCEVFDKESDVTQASKLNRENFNKILKEIFDVHSKEVLGYSTNTLSMKKIPQIKPQTVVKPPIPSNILNCHQQSFTQRETFIVVDRVPQLHLEASGDHYRDDNGRSPDLLGTLLKQHSQWRSTSHTEACITSTSSVTSQAALEEKPEQNTDIVSMISKTLSVCNVSENLEENSTAAKGDLHSDQTKNSQTLTGFYDMKGSSAGSFTASSVSHVSVATTISSNSPVGGSVTTSSGVNTTRYIGLPANNGNKSSKALVGINVPSVAGKQAGMVLMMVYGNREECARVGCGPRWVHRSQIQDNDIPSSKMSKMMDKDGTLDISFDEWRDYLLFHPSANLHDIIHYWRHATNLDIGEDLSVPDDFSPEEWVSGKWWRHLVAGGVAGMVSRTCTAPLDRLKVFLQVHGATKYRSLRDCFKYMIEEGGVKSLWRGNGVNVIKIAPESALKFAAYEQAKGFIMRNFGDADRELRIEERFAAGSFAGAFSQSVIYPMEVLKTRLAIRKSGQYRGIADAATQIFRTEGIRSFYRGYIPNLLGIIPYAGIDLAVYETLKKRYAQMRPGDKDPSVLVIIGCGALSSSCGQIASYPLALIRTRLQAQVMSKDRVPHPDQPTTSIGLFKQIIKKEGPLGLYRGIAPNFMKVAPAVSISYVVYEKFREALGVRMT